MIPGRGMRMARRGRMVRGAVGVAATANMVSNARRNRAERKAIGDQGNYDSEDMTYKASEPQDETVRKIEEMSDLRNRGLISQEEYEAKKKQILNL